MIWVLGHKGQLGRALTIELKNRYSVFTEEIDITDEDSVRRIIDQEEVKTIINCAAYTDVDKAESDPRNWEVNAYAPSMISEIASWKHIRFVQISSDYVYSNVTHPIIHNTFPLNAYGKAKMLADIAVYQASRMNTVLRVQNLCSEEKGIIKSILNLPDMPSLDSRVFVGPTSVYLLAKAVAAIFEKPGVYNYAPESSVRITDLFEYLSHGGWKSSVVERPAKRKLDNTMEVSSIFSSLGLCYSWQYHVKDICNRISVAKGNAQCFD